MKIKHLKDGYIKMTAQSKKDSKALLEFLRPQKRISSDELYFIYVTAEVQELLYNRVLDRPNACSLSTHTDAYIRLMQAKEKGYFKNKQLCQEPTNTN